MPRRTKVGKPALIRVLSHPLPRQGARFLISGGLNTLATLAVYWLLLLVMHYQLAYGLSYALGIFISYGLNLRYVFRASHSLRKVLMFPLVYVVGYGCGAMTLDLCTRVIGIDVRLGPLVAALVSMPITFLLSKLLLERKSSPSGTDRSSD